MQYYLFAYRYDVEKYFSIFNCDGLIKKHMRVYVTLTFYIGNVGLIIT